MLAVAYPLACGLLFFDVLIWTFAASLPGQVLVIITVFNWRKLSPTQRCLGLLPMPVLFLPFEVVVI